jgi:hypothetical protein
VSRNLTNIDTLPNLMFAICILLWVATMHQQIRPHLSCSLLPEPLGMTGWWSEILHWTPGPKIQHPASQLNSTRGSTICRRAMGKKVGMRWGRG